MFQIQWHERVCINCLKCVEVCPRDNLVTYRQKPTLAKVNTCTGCGYCSQSCPSGSIYHVTLNNDYWGSWNPEQRDNAFKMSQTGEYLVTGKGTDRKLLNWNNLVFLPGQLENPPRLESESVDMEVVIGPRAKKPVYLKTPLMLGAMSFGALSIEAKTALARASTALGTIANTGEGGMHDLERKEAKLLTLQYSTGRFGAGREYIEQADMIEIKIGQGAKPGLGGHLLADKVTPEIARVRDLLDEKSRFRPDVNAISPPRHPDIDSPEELRRKVDELREISGGAPIAIKIAGGNVEADLDIVVAAGPDVIVVDGGEGGTGAAPAIAKNHAGLPLPYFLPRVIKYLEKLGVREQFTLIAAGGLKGAADFAKVLALGADAVYTAGFAKFGLGCVYCRSCESGRCPTGITTQNPILRQRLVVDERALKVENLLRAAHNEIAKLCRLCGCTGIKDLNPNHLRALTPDIQTATGIKPAWQAD